MSARHTGRVLALQSLYQLDLVKPSLSEVLSFDWYDKKIDESEKEMATSLIMGVVENWETIDNIIKEYSRNWEFSRISVVNRCILRLSIYSLSNQKEIPARVVINEALELTREFEREESVSFINGILDAILKDELQRKETG
ncbi:MAG: transcription antitermination factor NusB [Leptospira sp.]|nr:transcription antitermination factor NusB [Leptospira sp.]